jgi:hypothetical protein
MKKIMIFILSALITVAVMPDNALCESVSAEAILQELKDLKQRIDQLEKKLVEKDQEIETLQKQTSHIAGHPEERLPVAKEAEEVLKLGDGIELSGLIEVEAGTERSKAKDPATMHTDTFRNDDIVLATVEIGMDADINKYVKGHALFLFEEDEDEDRVLIDEGTIMIGGIEETMGFYAIAGKYYPHFGELNSWFISDPLTLEIFEIRESAAQVGCEQDWFTAGIGAFHGDIQETGEDESRIKGFFADANFHNPEDTLGGASLLLGVSYLSNIADTDTLQDEDGADGNQIEDYVDGIAAYLVAEYEHFSLGIEYIFALDDFDEGEMAYAVDRSGLAAKSSPSAWNVEFAFRPVEMLQFAVKYEGTDDMFGLFPQDQYGGAVSWEMFDKTVLSAEYLHGKYDRDNRNADDMIADKRDVFTVQLAVEF